MEIISRITEKGPSFYLLDRNKWRGRQIYKETQAGLPDPNRNVPYRLQISPAKSS